MRPERPVTDRPTSYLEALSMLDAVVAERDELRQRVSRLKRLMRRLEIERANISVELAYARARSAR